MENIAVQRLFGASVSGNWDSLILSPIPTVWREFSDFVQLPMHEKAWFPVAALHHKKKRYLFVRISPGAVCSTDCLHFLQSAEVAADLVIFLGLTGALTPSITIGQIVVPERADRLETISSVFSAGVRVFDITPPTTRSPDCSILYGGHCASLPALAHETPDRLKDLRENHIDFVDLELAAIAAWCLQRCSRFLPLLVVSDHPTHEPIWRQNSVHPAVENSVRAVVRHVCGMLALNSSENGAKL